MKSLKFVIIILISIILNGCSAADSSEPIKIGLLLPSTIDDQGWNSKGYQGLLNIHSKHGADVHYKEEINSIYEARSAVKAFSKQDVELIFGHGQIFADYFMELKDEYPDIHFVAFNGKVAGNNITSLHIEGHSMGFFAGMVASEMSESNVVGVLAAYPWQPEVEGFIEGATYQNKDIKVLVEFVMSWVDEEEAIGKYTKMANKQADVFYPAGDGFHVSLIEEIKREGLYAIGFVSDQSDLGQSTILTSTVQHVDALYLLVTEQYMNGDLLSGNHYFDFQDGVVSLGPFGQDVPEELQEEINLAIDEYIESGNLPNVNEDY